LFGAAKPAIGVSAFTVMDFALLNPSLLLIAL
jgi:hypothetical protein